MNLEHRLAFAVALCFAFKPCKEMTKQAAVTLNRIDLCFRLGVHLYRYKMPVRFPIIGHDASDVLEGTPQLSSCCCVAAIQYAVDESFSMSINSNPYPAVVFFEAI